MPKKQEESEASYFPVLNGDDAKIDWNKSANDLHNQIRSLYPWITCYTLYKDEFLMINGSKIIDLDNQVNISGKILSKTKNSLTVSTGHPKKALMISGIQIYGLMGKIFGKYWTQNYINKRIKIGDRLENV